MEMSVGKLLYQAYVNSDMVGRWIVIILLLASAVLWSVILDKAGTMWSTRKSCKRFLKRYDSVKSSLAIGLYMEEFTGPLKNVCAAGLKELFEIMGMSEHERNDAMRRAVLSKELTQAELDKVKSTMNRCVNQECLELNSKLPCLSILVTCAPYLGLFGTVWGVMATFIAIATSGSIEISAIAPGISGALLTTVAGLFVAIPAVVCSYLINAAVTNTALEMDIFVDEFLAGLRLEDSAHEEPEGARHN